MKKTHSFFIVLVFFILGCSKAKVRFSEVPLPPFDPLVGFQAIAQLPANCSAAYPVRIIFSKQNDGSFSLRSCTQLKWQASQGVYSPNGNLSCIGSLNASTGATTFSFNSTSCGGPVDLNSSGEVSFQYNCTGFHNRMIGEYLVGRDSKDPTKILSVGFLGTACAPVQDLAPVITNPGNQSNIEGNLISLRISATDPEGSPIAYSATGLPTGLSINSITGYITGSVAVGARTSSPYIATVRASDGNNTSSASFTWTITAASTLLPPNVTNPGTRINSDTNVVSLQIQASSPQGSALSYSATGLPTGLSINSATGLISGTIGSSASAASPYSSSVSVRDTVANLTTTVSFAWNVTALVPNTATLTWSPNTESDLAGYKIYHSEISGNFTTQAPVVMGTATTYTWNNLTRGRTHYFAISAYDTSQNESPLSIQVSKFIP